MKINKWVEFLKLSKKLMNAKNQDDQDNYLKEVWKLIYNRPLCTGNEYIFIKKLYSRVGGLNNFDYKNVYKSLNEIIKNNK